MRQMTFSISTTSFRSLELLLSKTASLCEKLRHKSRSGNSWWKPTAPIWRLSLFAENALNRRIHASWQKRSQQREKFRWKRLPRRQPKPRKDFFSSIGHEHKENRGATSGRTENTRQNGRLGDPLSCLASRAS